MKYNVRCCCQPQKIFGTLDIPAVTARFPREVNVNLRIPVTPLVSLSAPPACEYGTDVLWTTNFEVVVFRLRWFGRDELAVYSDDRPIEFWRGIPGFEEKVDCSCPTCTAARKKITCST